MMVPRRLVMWALGTLILTDVSLAQRDIRGTVRDAETGAPLPAAHLQIEGTNHGTTTNAEGAFVLFLNRTPAVLLARYVGYRSARIEVRSDTPLPIDIALAPDTLLMEEIVVSGEDPAVEIMRRVIAKKEALRDQFQSYRAEGYSRFMLYRDQTLIQMREWITEAYWQAGAGPREIVRASRRRPAASGHFRFADLIAVPNFYDDLVTLFGLPFIGPTHPDALNHYTFRIDKPATVDGRPVHVIYVTPTLRTQASFVGRLLVLADEDVLLSVYLRPAWHMIPPPPLEERIVHYEQHFEVTREGFPVPVDLRADGTIRFGRAGVHYPPARFSQVSRLTYHVPNWPVPDSLVSRTNPVAEEPFSSFRDALFAGNPADIPLTDEESLALRLLRPNQTIQSAFRPSGLLAGYGPIRVEEPASDQLEEASERRTVSRPRPWSWYNRVDGAQLGLALPLVFSPRWSAELGAGYTFERKRPVYRGEIAYVLSPTRSRLLGFDVRLDGGDVAASTYGSRVYAPLITSVATYFGYDDTFDYYRQRRLAGEAGIRWRGFRIGSGVAVERHDSLSKRTEWEGWLKENAQRPNPPVAEGQVLWWTTRLELGPPAGASLLAPGSGLQLRADLAPGGVGSENGAFARYTGDLRWSVRTFLRRRAVPPRLRLRAVAGVTTGRAPPQALHILDTGLGPLSPFGSLRTLAGLPVAGTRAAGLFWEHDFGTLLFERLRLAGIAERGVGLTLHGAHGRVWSAGDAGPDSPEHGRLHHEIGVSLTELLRFPVRVDFTWRLDEPGFRVGMGFTATRSGGRLRLR